MTIRAIETHYKGYKFRSRLEARWAVFFDALGVEWLYESEGYELGNGVRYLPDFWLKEPKCWVEIKPTTPTPEEVDKAGLLAAQSGKWVNIIYGTPWPDEYAVLALRNNYPNELYRKYWTMAVENNEPFIVRSLLGRNFILPILQEGARLHGWNISQWDAEQKPYAKSLRCLCYCEHHKRLSFGHLMDEIGKRCTKCGQTGMMPVEEREWEKLGRCFGAEDDQDWESCGPLVDNRSLGIAFSKARSARFEYGEGDYV